MSLAGTGRKFGEYCIIDSGASDNRLISADSRVSLPLVELFTSYLASNPGSDNDLLAEGRSDYKI